MLYHLIRQIKSHLNLSRVDRDTYISLTVLAGMLTKMFIFNYEYEYHQLYMVGMMHGVFYLTLLSAAIKLTFSYRLSVMMAIVCISVILDGVNCVSPDAYYLTHSFRREGLLCFSNVYMVVEVVCVLSIFRINAGEWFNKLFINRHIHNH